MIVLIVTGAHQDTHQVLRKTGRFDFRILSYRQLFRSSSLRQATYIFGDLDRLDFWELEVAARLFRHIRDLNFRVLNDPARARQRFSLLRILKQKGLNNFDAWRVEDRERPNRFPVFLRTESAHRGPLSDLLHGEEDVRKAVDLAVAQGYPMRELILIQYCAQPIREGLFRKHAIYRLGDRMVPGLAVHESSWRVKRGENGIAGPDLYEDEYQSIVENPYDEALKPAFEAAHIEYGRADFGVVDGRPQVYEINTNPSIRDVQPHPFPIRIESMRLAFDKLVEAFEAIDTTAGPRVSVRDEKILRQLKKIRKDWIP